MFFLNEEQKRIRDAICKTCKSYIEEKQICNECKCFMPWKIELKLAKCPLGKWLDEKVEK